ncbi:hypothetical protein BBD42_19625 [Paenibacillus sp. BIHB 4019]|uniref:SLH domain-containing protein n=1 Tax=Paenibacillus sp. BIHB 4019 TaxID=1870819 RepID=A0A1B2DL49_9BACL|nr:S-layer homology domain-containing protein [Paenibacillus sp. BIHB 4019]ANY68434.1 hypothetical protein BBD42_19625 [Paenibacillus sp. BIHB 4019]
MRRSTKAIVAFFVSANLLMTSSVVMGKEAVKARQDLSSVRQAYASTSAAPVFTDIKGHWAESTIKKAVSDGYLKGYSNGTFKPNGLITRAELASVLVRITKNKNDGSKASFTDVQGSYWAASAINGAVGTGFVKSGDAPGAKFNPNQAMTRYDMAKWFSQGLVRSEPSFATAIKEVEGTLLPFTETYNTGISKTQTPYIAIARGTGLMKGKPDNSFGLKDTTTRAEVAVMIYRYLKIEGSKAENYTGLNEMREVGLYGTNVMSFGKARDIKGVDGKPRNIHSVMGKTFNLAYGFGSFTLDRVIVVNLSEKIGSEARGIYGEMFYDEIFEGWSAYTEQTVTASREMDNISRYINGYPTLTGGPLPGDLPEKYGYETMPTDSGKGAKYEAFSDFVSLGKPKTFWTGISAFRTPTFLTAADGTEATVYMYW